MPTDEPGTGQSPSVPGITVVVPAYNPGPYLDRCLKSLLEQTLDRSRYDVIVVDDGSDDGSAERLDRAAREHPGLIRVEHIPRSGWPGRPRNVGTDLSGREYVFYCDADDWLLPHALELVLDRAEADRADIVMARPVGNRRRVAIGIYERGDRCTTWRETPGVFSNLTCQKAFRREFLRERDVRFGEGRVRLEDFIFMTAAYLRAERISIVGSRPCYVFELRDDGQNITSTRATEDEFFSSVEKIVDVILADTEPGRDQDIALDRVVRSEIIGPLSRPGLLGKAPQAQAEALAHASRLLLDKVPPSAVARQDVVTRSWARLIQDGDLSAIARQIEADEAVALSVVIEDVTWDGPRLRVRFSLAFRRDGEVLRLERDGERLFRPRASASGEPIDVTDAFARSGGQVHLRSRAGSDEWRVRVDVRPESDDDGSSRAMAWTGTADIDVHTLASGEPIALGVWDVSLAFQSCGYSRQGRPRAAEGSTPEEPPISVEQGRRVRAYWTRKGELAVTVRAADGSKGAPAERSRTLDVRRVRAAGRRAAQRALRRAATRLAARGGLTVTDVGRGMALVTRSPAVDVVPLSRKRSWVVSRRADNDSAPVPQLLGERHWIVPATGDPAAALEVSAVGSRGWLVSKQDKHPLAAIHLENQTMQHLADRHVAWLLARYEVDVVLDVGANTGQYGRGLRRSGFRGRIESFEPVPHFADAVEAHSTGDAGWTVHRIALGSSEGTVPIRVQRTFSSLLPASDYGKGRFSTLREAADKEDRVVDVPLRRLDSVLNELLPQVVRADGRPPRVFLKMNTQGFDLEAFRGLGDRAGDIVGLQSEVALLLIYEGMPRMPEAIATYEAAGFELSGLYPVTTEPDGRVIEYDCVMVRASEAP